MSKTGKADGKFWILLGVLVVGILHTADVIDLANLAGTSAPPEEQSAGTGAFCAIEDTTYTITLDDVKNAGTNPSAAADDAIGIFVDGTKKDGAYASGDSLTLSPGSKVDLYYYDDAKDDAMTSANTVKHSFVVPCSGVKDDTLKIWDLGTEGTTAATWPTDGTAVILDDTYTNIKGSENGYDIPAGGSKNLGKFELTYTNDKGYGSPDGKLCMVIAANKTLIKDVKVTGTGVADVNCKPDGFSETILTVGAFTAGQIDYFDFEIPSMQDNKAQLLTMEIEYEANQDGTTSEDDDLTFMLFDQQWYYDADDGTMKLGYEDENNQLIGAANIGENVTIQ